MGRTGRKETPCGLREERIEGVPSSFKKLNLFLRVRKRDLADYVTETCERRFEGAMDIGGEVVEHDMEIDTGEEDTLEMGPEVEMGPSDNDDEYSDEEYEMD